MASTPEGWEGYKNARAFSLVANALAVGGGLTLLGYMILHDNTALKCGTADGQDCELNDDGTLMGGTSGYDDAALAGLTGYSGLISAVVAVLVTILMFVAMRMVSKSRKMCKAENEHPGELAEESAVGHQKMTHKEAKIVAKENARTVLYVQLFANFAAWALNVALIVFLVIDWVRDCPAGEACDADSAVPLTILSFIYACVVFFGQTAMAGVLIYMLVVHDDICEKDPRASVRQRMGERFSSVREGIRRRLPGANAQYVSANW